MLKNVLRSWILSLQDIGMAKTLHCYTWPLAWRRVDAPNGLLHNWFAVKVSSCNASTTAVSITKPSWTACYVLWWWMWSIHCMIQTSPQRRAWTVNSLHDPNFTTVWSMSWPDSNQLQPLCLPWVLKPAPGNFGIKLFRHAICLFETPQTWPSCHWDVLLAISCAWAPCTPTSLPCSRKWVNTLLIRNAEAKAWTAWMTARASTSEPLVARTPIMKESRMRTGPFGLHGSSSFHDVQSTKSSASSETKQWSRHTEKRSYSTFLEILNQISISLHAFEKLHHYRLTWDIDLIST